MHLRDKMLMDRQQLMEQGPITIVAFGDSVTHGAFSLGEIDQESAYWNILKKRILQIRNYVPINVINAGIGGCCAKDSVERMDSQVLKHDPDLLIVAFGLNDVNGSLEDYLNALKAIFEKSLQAGIDTIFMTPNMLNTYVAEDTDESLKEYAGKTAQMQTSGRMDRYMQSAVSLAHEMGIAVCDCYEKWKKMSQTQDTTLLLANRINHPTKQMHHLFADCLFNTIFQENIQSKSEQDSTMYEPKE